MRRSGAFDPQRGRVAPAAQGAGVGDLIQGDHRRPGSVAEKDAGVPVGEVRNAAELLGPDDQRVGARVLQQQPPGRLQRVNKAGAAALRSKQASSSGRPSRCWTRQETEGEA